MDTLRLDGRDWKMQIGQVDVLGGIDDECRRRGHGMDWAIYSVWKQRGRTIGEDIAP